MRYGTSVDLTCGEEVGVFVEEFDVGKEWSVFDLEKTGFFVYEIEAGVVGEFCDEDCGFFIPEFVDYVCCFWDVFYYLFLYVFFLG